MKNTLTLRPFGEKEARESCAWRYAPPYDVYDQPSWEEACKNGWGMSVREKRESEFFAVYGDDELTCYFRLSARDGYVMLGLGLKPECCGRGLGSELMKLIAQTAARLYPGVPVRLVVRKFNQRAIRCYERAGFAVIGEQERDAPGGRAMFVAMEK